MYTFVAVQPYCVLKDAELIDVHKPRDIGRWILWIFSFYTVKAAPRNDTRGFSIPC